MTQNANISIYVFWQYCRKNMHLSFLGFGFFPFCVIIIVPIMIQTSLGPQNVRLNLSFVKDKHTYGKKMARKGPTTVVYQYLSFPIRV